MQSFFAVSKGLLLGCTAASALVAAPVWAQAAPAAANSQRSDTDIIVTANRVETLASKTAVTVTALTGEGLRDAGIAQPINLVERVPGIEISRSRSGLDITIRGVASSDTTEKGDSSTAFLLDGVNIARAPMKDGSFYDVARVEVLRGPQGTLFGRNSTAGIINVITNRPVFDFGGTVDVAYGNLGNRQATGVLNVPVSENFALRGAINYEHGDSITIGGPRTNPSYKKFRELVSGRLSGLFRWGSGEILVRGDYADIGGSLFNALDDRKFFRQTASGPVYIGQSSSTKELRRNDIVIPWDLYRNNNLWGVGAEVTQELGPINLYYVGSYRHMDRDEQGAFPFVVRPFTVRSREIDTFKQQSHELRAAYSSDALKLQVGAYYFKERSHVNLRVNVGINTTPNGEAGPTLLFDLNPTTAESYAVFAQGTYSLTDSLRVTGGIRYSHDNKTRAGIANFVCVDNFFNCAAPAGAATERADVSFTKTTYKGTIEYDAAPNTLVYATIATGYKAGGFNDGCVVGTAPGCTVPLSTFYFDPETLTSYEAGIKSRFLDNAVQIAATAFHYDYKNLQLTSIVSPCPATANVPDSACGVVQSAAAAKIDGAELEGTVTPSRLDRFDFSVAYLNARYDDYQATPTVNLAGAPLDRSPKLVFTAGYQHSFELGGDYELVASARTRVSDSYTFLTGTSAFARQPSFSKTDLTLSLNAPGKRWYLQGFVKNIENTLSLNSTAIGGNFPSVNVADPRTYGARAGFKF